MNNKPKFNQSKYANQRSVKADEFLMMCEKKPTQGLRFVEEFRKQKERVNG